MANAASTIEIELEIRQAINRLDNLQRQLSKSTQSFDKAAQATRKFEGAINKAKAGMVAFFAAISLQKLAQLSDAMTQFENRVKLATNSLVQQLAVQQQLFLVAQKTALPLEDVGQLYSRLRIAAEQLGASQRDLINLTETVGLALKASGTSAASAQGALLQLGQALNSPRVQAEEFNSLIDGMPNLLREVEKHLGLTAGGLKKFVTDGQLSNKKFFDAILASQKALTQQANSSASTIEQANQRVANSFTSLIGAIDDKLGASKFFTGFIDGLASGIDKLSNFLGLTTQATGGGGANLDEVIRGAAPSGSQYAFPTIGAERITASIERFPNYVQEINSLEELKSLELDLLFVREDQAKQIAKAVNSNKETIDILGAQNVPLKEAQGYLDLENKLLDSIIQKRKIELQQNKENLTYLEQATIYLKEQFNLNDRTAGAIVSGVSGAGPNASRAANIAQSKSIEEAAAKLILSNEKVAKVIDESFEILFEILDPILDVLGDLLSAINRLIGALLEGAGNAIENFADSIGLGPDSYYGGGGFTRDIEALGGAAGGGSSPTSAEIATRVAISSLNELTTERSSVVNALSDAAEESGNVAGTIEAFTQQVDTLIQNIAAGYSATYGGFPESLRSFESVVEAIYSSIDAGNFDSVQEVADYFSQDRFKVGPEGDTYLREDAAITAGAANALLAIEELVDSIVGTETGVVSDFEKTTSLIYDTAEAQIQAMDFQNLTLEEQIEFRYQETAEMLNQQRTIAALVQDEEKRTALLERISKAEAKTLELKNKQLEALEREQQLLQLQNVESGLQALLSDFERTIEKINDLVQGLFDQVNELLFSDFNLAGPQETFALAQDTYESLLENAFDSDATEEDIKALQGFVNEYLTAARNVFKSSTAFTDIFEAVLGDLTGLGLQAGFNMPIQAAGTLSSGAEDLLGDLPEELQTAVSDMISGLNLATLAFAQQQVEFLTTVYEIPLTIDNDLLVVDTSGVNKPVELTNSNFSIDPQSLTQIDLSVLMSTEMFTVNTSQLNFGTITPSASAGTPYLGVVTPTVSLNTSSVTDSFNSLSSAINSAIQSFNESLAEAAIYARLGFDYEQGVLNSTYFMAYTSTTNKTEQERFALTAIEDQRAEAIRKYGDSGYNYVISYVKPTGVGQIEFYRNLSDATSGFNYLSSNSHIFSSIQKYGFRQGGLVPDPMDTIPAMLSPGEYILSPETVRRYGVSNLNRLNSGDTAALNATSDPEVKRLLAELIVAVKENDTEVNVFTDMEGQTKASIEEFRSELRERTRRQGDKFLPARYI